MSVVIYLTGLQGGMDVVFKVGLNMFLGGVILLGGETYCHQWSWKRGNGLWCCLEGDTFLLHGLCFECICTVDIVWVW